MGLEVYVDLMSQPCRALVLFLRANKVPHNLRLVHLRKGEHLTEEFAKLNPVQRVPVIVHDGFRLTESIAMYRYLREQSSFAIADHWYPADLKSRARVDEFLEWHHLNLRFFASMVFRTRVLSGEALDSAKVQNYVGMLDGTLSVMERSFLNSRAPFLNGLDRVSVADLVAVTELEQPIAAGYDVAKEHPWVGAYMGRVRTAIGPALYDEVHTVCHRVRDRVAAGKL